jgi:hypothetical protein
MGLQKNIMANNQVGVFLDTNKLKPITREDAKRLWKVEEGVGRRVVAVQDEETGQVAILKQRQKTVTVLSAEGTDFAVPTAQSPIELRRPRIVTDKS